MTAKTTFTMTVRSKQYFLDASEGWEERVIDLLKEYEGSYPYAEWDLPGGREMAWIEPVTVEELSRRAEPMVRVTDAGEWCALSELSALVEFGAPNGIVFLGRIQGFEQEFVCEFVEGVVKAITIEHEKNHRAGR